jgi:threonine dehydrogenase-like Zn-dependent dehydrogenase
MRLPQHVAYRVGDHVALDHACLGEPIVATHHLIQERAQVKVGDDVVIVGPGPMGIMAVQYAKLCGARQVILIGLRSDEKRLGIGRLLGAEFIPPAGGRFTDALALLDFGRREGFLIAAFTGLVRTFFSSYRKVRAALGLQQYEADDLIARLAAHGLTARRHQPNLGHNQSRMAFIAVRTDAEAHRSHV